MSDGKHILVLGFPAFGHLIPMLELSKKISKVHRVSFAVSEGILSQVVKRELFSSADFPNLKMIGIKDGYQYVDGEIVSKEEVFQNLLTMVNKGCEDLIRALPGKSERVLDDSAVGNAPVAEIQIPDRVDAVISDIFQGKALSACHDLGIPFYMFNCGGAGFLAAIASVDEDTPVAAGSGLSDENPFMEEPEPGSPPPPINEFIKWWFLPIRNNFSLATGIIVNSTAEIEKFVLPHLSAHPLLQKVTIRCVGPLMPLEAELTSTKLAQQEKIKAWLDHQENGSVAYVSFGSVAFPVAEQLAEVGKGLLSLGKPFIFSLSISQYAHLPAEFREKVIDGPEAPFLLVPWTPQKIVLAHPATAVFVSHCGWNSSLESLFNGTPILGWPLFGDQLANAKLVAKSGAGELVVGTGLVGKRIVPAEEVVEKIAKVAGWNGGSMAYQLAAKEWQKKIVAATDVNGSSQKDFESLLKFEN